MARNRNYPWYQIEKVTDLRNMIENSASRFGTRPAFLLKSDGKQQAISHREFKEKVFALGPALFDNGFAPGHKGCDPLGIQVGMGSKFPRGRVRQRGQRAAGQRFEGKGPPVHPGRNRCPGAPHFFAIFGPCLELQAQLPCLQRVVCFDLVKPAGKRESPIAFRVFRSSSTAAQASWKKANRALRIWKSILICPSVSSTRPGTMGSAKGVVLSQHNLVSNMMDMCQAVYIDENDVLISVLPLNHTYESTCGLLTPLYRGAAVSYCENLRQIANQMQEVRATPCLASRSSSRRFTRKIMDGIREKGIGQV